MTQNTAMLAVAIVALLVALGTLAMMLTYLRVGRNVVEDDRGARVEQATSNVPRIRPRGRVPWNGVRPASPQVPVTPPPPLGVGPTLGGAGRFRPVTRAGDPAPAVEGLDGRLTGRVRTNPNALCTVCGVRLTECGGHR